MCADDVLMADSGRAITYVGCGLSLMCQGVRWKFNRKSKVIVMGKGEARWNWRIDEEIVEEVK